jgi:lambda repressor-like predicted transcriptional regulator
VVRMAARYQEAATVCELASEFGCNRLTVAERLKKNGIAMRAQSSTSQNIDAIVRLHSSGLSPMEIGKQIGFCANTVRNSLQGDKSRYGIRVGVIVEVSAPSHSNQPVAKSARVIVRDPTRASRPQATIRSHSTSGEASK